MRVRIDPTRCRGYGMCLELAAPWFSADDWGLVQALGDEIADADRPAVQRAVDACPYAAISWVPTDARVPRLVAPNPTTHEEDR